MNIKKMIFHTFTNHGGEVSYYGEAYLVKCGSMAARKPFKFAWNLMKINFHYGIAKSKAPLNLSGIKEKDINQVYSRLKLTQNMRIMLDYKHLITDLWGSLLKPVLSEEALYKILEDDLQIEGFAKARKKFDDKKLSIEEIYNKIEKEVQKPVSPDLEIEMVSNTVIVNPYVLDILDTVAANHTSITALIDSSYPEEMFNDILRKNMIYCISEIVTTSHKKKNIRGLVSEYVRKYKKEEKRYEKSVRIFASDYDKYILNQRRKGNTASYYPAPEYFLKKNNIPDFKSDFGELYKIVEGNLNYSKPFSRSDTYQTAVLYLAPVIFGFLQEVVERADERKIVFIGSSEHMIVKYFNKYMGNAHVIEWSYLVANQPKKSDDWDEVFRCMPFLDKISADRIAFGLGFTAPAYKLERAKSDFMKAWRESRSGKSDNYIEESNSIKSYLESFLNDKESVFFVDLTENDMAGKSLLKKLKEYNICPDYDYFSIHDYFEESDMEESVKIRLEELIQNILQMELPVLLKIGEDKLSFAQAPMVPTEEKERLSGGINEYIRIMSNLTYKNKSIPKITVDEAVKLLLSGETSIQRLKRRLVG